MRSNDKNIFGKPMLQIFIGGPSDDGPDVRALDEFPKGLLVFVWKDQTQTYEMKTYVIAE